MAGLDRRALLAGAGAAGALLAGRAAFAQAAMKDIGDLAPGDFTWHPERAPKGPVAVVVSIPQQRVHLYRNGLRIAVSTCSTGKPGHSTPTGVFVVLEKDRHHRSSTYSGAPMPNMNRLTWSGIALHAGNLPGYPASHGCVRLPMAFSERLFGVTHLGTPVIIAGSHSDPWELTHPGMVLGAYAEHEFETAVAGLKGKKHPSDWEEAEAAPITSIIASTADNIVELIENDVVVARSPLTVKGGGGLGQHVFMLTGAAESIRGLRWSAITHHEASAALGRPDDLVRRLVVEPAFAATMARHIHPGTTMILTDAPLTPDRRSGRDFVVVASD